MVHNSMAKPVTQEALEHYPSMLARGLTVHAMQKFGCTCDEEYNIYIPVPDFFGHVESVLIRTSSGPDKYVRVPENAQNSVFNISNMAHYDSGLPVIVFESPLDVMATYPTRGVALIGTALYPRQVFMLSALDTPGFIISMDSDQAGIAAAPAIAYKLAHFKPIVIDYTYNPKTNLRDLYKQILDQREGTITTYGQPTTDCNRTIHRGIQNTKKALNRHRQPFLAHAGKPV